MSNWIVSAYNAAPPTTDRDQHGRFLDAITRLPGVGGLEIPYAGALSAGDERWLLRRVHTRRDYVITTIPDTMNHVERDARNGLASLDDAGRAAAVQRVGHVADVVRRCHDAAGARVVRAVTLYSAPRSLAGGSSATALARSLLELAEFDWNGARLVVEHCDAPMAARPVVKGFLPLETEVEAVALARERTGTDFGILLNWGRSMVEQRSVDGVLGHIALVRSAGLLAGLTLSGCSPIATPYGPAWDDCHAPPRPICPSSELDLATATTALAAAGSVPFLGVKVSAPVGADVATRIATVARTLCWVRAARLEARAEVAARPSPVDSCC
ncbi:DUF4862 family protein [Nocardia camponoti]|uniref:DUF4862 domain-containing protein n=1 Tax=Nocardia camponoti TaxID=1616106 RepID=A0A917V5X1_9NOCA|nr:DUF4862 family protein [Nocardia camponoti]GGK42029.1 DUF4862 domain-containing protein [Nocardia camponoti]